MAVRTESAPPAISRTSDLASGSGRLVTTVSANDWGLLPALSLVGAFGLLLLALADTGARDSRSWAMPLFWIGLLTLFAPIAARQASPRVLRRERIGLVALLGIWLYLAKVLHSPIYFTFVDEFQHWRTVEDIVQSGRLLQPNPILPASPSFPGLEIVTAAVSSTTGLTLFDAGLVVLGVARLVFALALYGFYEEISRSARAAGIASVLYMSNKGFVFFDSVFAYESLALPFAALTLFVIVRRARGTENIGLTLVCLLGIGAVTITHHLTSYALMAYLIVWALVDSLWTKMGAISKRYSGETSSNQATRTPVIDVASWWKGPREYMNGDADQPGPGSAALFAVVAGVTWLAYVAISTAKYLALPLWRAVMSLIRFIAGEEIGRQFFLAGGHVAPLWEQIAAYTSVGLILLLLPFGLLQTWRHHANKVSVALAVWALAYPLSETFRLTESGTQLSSRTPPFLFAAIAFVLAIGVLEVQPLRLPVWGQVAAFTVWATVIFVGQVVLGWPEFWRLPGPYLVSSHTRSVELQGIASAKWVRAYLGSDNRMIADWVNYLLMGSYGHQRVVTRPNDGVRVAPIYFAATIGPTELAVLQNEQIRYVVVDRRLSRGLPIAGWYFENGELGTSYHTRPIDPAVLEKFDQLEKVSRPFDSGDIVIYDVGGLSRAP